MPINQWLLKGSCWLCRLGEASTRPAPWLQQPKPSWALGLGCTGLSWGFLLGRPDFVDAEKVKFNQIQ